MSAQFLSSCGVHGWNGHISDAQAYCSAHKLDPSEVPAARPPPRQQSSGCIAAHAPAVQQKPPVAAVLKPMQLTIEAKTETQWGDTVVLVGSTAQLGSWQPSRGIRLCTDASSYPVWSVTLPLDAITAGDAPPEFKLVILRASSEVEWEPLPGNRRMVPPVAGRRSRVALTWGDPATRSVELSEPDLASMAIANTPTQAEVFAAPPPTPKPQPLQPPQPPQQPTPPRPAAFPAYQMATPQRLAVPPAPLAMPPAMLQQPAAPQTAYDPNTASPRHVAPLVAPSAKNSFSVTSVQPGYAASAAPPSHAAFNCNRAMQLIGASPAALATAGMANPLAVDALAAACQQYACAGPMPPQVPPMRVGPPGGPLAAIQSMDMSWPPSLDGSACGSQYGSQQSLHSRGSSCGLGGTPPGS